MAPFISPLVSPWHTPGAWCVGSKQCPCWTLQLSFIFWILLLRYVITTLNRSASSSPFLLFPSLSLPLFMCISLLSSLSTFSVPSLLLPSSPSPSLLFSLTLCRCQLSKYTVLHLAMKKEESFKPSPTLSPSMTPLALCIPLRH